MALNPDLKEFIESLNASEVEYAIVGAHALAFHGHPRFTADIDIAIPGEPENAERLKTALTAFGFADIGFDPSDPNDRSHVVQLGRAPNRIDLIFELDGVSLRDVVAGSVAGTLDGIPVRFISRDHLIRNKRSVGRPQDLADAEALEPGGAS